MSEKELIKEVSFNKVYHALEKIKENNIFYLDFDSHDRGSSFHSLEKSFEVEEQILNKDESSVDLSAIYEILFEYALDNTYYKGKKLGNHLEEVEGDYLNFFVFKHDLIGFYPVVAVYTQEEDVVYLPFIN